MAVSSAQPGSGPENFTDRPNPFVELALVLPIFIVYHLGVVFLDIQNATDFLTTFGMSTLAGGSKFRYLGLTACVGIVLGLLFLALGRGQAFQKKKFFQIAVEGVVYAVVMRIASAFAVTQLFASSFVQERLASLPSGGLSAAASAATPTLSLAPQGVSSPLAAQLPGASGPIEGLVLSCGAGFYEEFAFRVVLFGLGAKLLLWFFAHEQLALTGGTQSQRKLSARGVAAALLWAIVASAIFSGIHYVGPLGDPFQLKSFLFRFVLGLCLTLVYLLRGFAAAVWTHTVYDIWVLVF